MGTLRRYVETIRENYRDREFWADAPGFLWRNVLTAPLRTAGFALARRGERPLALVESDWDNCILLDACRYDAFAEALGDRAGTLERRWAPGSQTGAFLDATFPPDGSFPEIVYVNGNPRVATEYTGRFHAIDHVWERAWDDEYDTVLPGAMREAALAANERCPDKRLFVHFVQPHIPYVGETAKRLPGGASIQTMRPGAENREAKPYAAAERGAVAPETIRQAYRESLDLAMAAVDDLVAALPGKTVVTADHGELLGERSGLRYGELSKWGHPERTPTEELLAVPWWEPPADRRKGITAGDATAGDRTDAPTDRLEALGYR
jgi:hypothetical protein